MSNQDFEEASSISGVIPGSSTAAGISGASNLGALKRQGYKNMRSPFGYGHLSFAYIRNPVNTAFTVDNEPYTAKEIGQHLEAGVDSMVIKLNQDYPEHNLTAA